MRDLKLIHFHIYRKERMSDTSVAPSNPTRILIDSVVKSVGKREFLKCVESMYGIRKMTENRIRRKVPVDEQCHARVKGERTGIKVGRNVLFNPVRCDRKCVGDSNLCPIHTNKKERKNDLPYGLYDDPLTNEQEKIFGESY